MMLNDGNLRGQAFGKPGVESLANYAQERLRQRERTKRFFIVAVSILVLLGCGVFFALAGRENQPGHFFENRAVTLFPATGTETSRGFMPMHPSAPLDKQVTPGKGYAVLFATTRYEDRQWQQLRTPASDVREIADDLRNMYGFEVERIDDPKVEDIRKKIHKLAEMKYPDGDQLFIMFSGHGDKDETLKKGWIIARDSKAAERQSAYPYSELREDIDNIPCRHILLVLDVCFGGTFDPSIKDAQARTKEYTEASTEEFIRRKLKYRSRLYVSSVDQMTAAPEGQGHSPFAWKFLEALRSGGGPDGVLTWSELVGFLEKLNPEPRGGVFPKTVNSDPGGDFLFVMRK